MKLNDWLDAEIGRSMALAKKVGVHKSAVSAWRYMGVPPKHWRRVIKATHGEVSLTDLALQLQQVREAA